jgi:hypothetical protein
MRFKALTQVALAALVCASASGTVWDRGAHTSAALGRESAAGTARQASDDAPQVPKPAPRVQVAGLDSLRVTSSVRFRDPTAAPHVFDVSLAFPARARLALRSVGGSFGQRVLRYARCGELYGFGLRAVTSTRLEGAERSDELLSIEARRAAFVWPEAHTWSGDGTEQRAELAGLGTLVAELAASAVSSPADPEGKDGARELRPRRIRALRADGSEIEALEITGWRRLETRPGARAWPQGFCLSVAGTVIWDEEVQLVERPSPWPDEWFVPPDRRTPRDASLPGLRAIDLTGAVVREIEVPSVGGQPSSLAAALEFARRVAAEERTGGRVLDGRTILVVSPELEPRSVRLMLADEHAPVPDGWRHEPPQPAWLAFYDQPGDVRRRDVERLLLAAPTVPTGSPTLLLVVTGEPKGGVQLMLVDRPR